MNTTQVTVRNVDPKLKQAIAQKARNSGKSINAWMLEAAREKAGLKQADNQNSWKKMAGSIPMSDLELQQTFADLRKVDPKDWV